MKQSDLEICVERISNFFKEKKFPCTIKPINQKIAKLPYSHHLELNLHARAFSKEQYDMYTSLVEFVFRVQGFTLVQPAKYLVNIDGDFVICKECGCSWENACPGGCSWVKPELCSSCNIT